MALIRRQQFSTCEFRKHELQHGRSQHHRNGGRISFLWLVERSLPRDSRLRCARLLRLGRRLWLGPWLGLGRMGLGWLGLGLWLRWPVLGIRLESLVVWSLLVWLWSLRLWLWSVCVWRRAVRLLLSRLQLRLVQRSAAVPARFLAR